MGNIIKSIKTPRNQVRQQSEEKQLPADKQLDLFLYIMRNDESDGDDGDNDNNNSNNNSNNNNSNNNNSNNNNSNNNESNGNNKNANDKSSGNNKDYKGNINDNYKRLKLLRCSDEVCMKINSLIPQHSPIFKHYFKNNIKKALNKKELKLEDYLTWRYINLYYCSCTSCYFYSGANRKTETIPLLVADLNLDNKIKNDSNNSKVKREDYGKVKMYCANRINQCVGCKLYFHNPWKSCDDTSFTVGKYGFDVCCTLCSEKFAGKSKVF